MFLFWIIFEYSCRREPIGGRLIHNVLIMDWNPFYISINYWTAASWSAKYHSYTHNLLFSERYQSKVVLFFCKGLGSDSVTGVIDFSTYVRQDYRLSVCT